MLSPYPPQMSDHFSGHRYHQQQWLCRWSNQNVIPDVPFAFSNYFYHHDLFTVVYSGGGHLLHHPVNHRGQPITNMRIGTWGRGGAKAYFRFHGGIGGGCGGVACRNTQIAARPLQLFDALNPIDFQIPMIGLPVLPEEASSGTGVFLPVYPKRIRASEGMHIRGGPDDGRQRRRGHIKQENTISKTFEGDVVEKKEPKDNEEIPMELLLPSEWTY